MKKNSYFSLKWVMAVVLTLLAILALLPFLYMALVSFTQKRALNFDFSNETFNLSNYVRVFKNLNIARNLYNSLIVTVGACALNLVVSSMAAYGFSQKRFRGRDALFSVYLATLMIPSQVTLIPLFVLMKTWNLTNTHFALMLPVINAFGVFLMRQFMLNLPKDLLEAAKIDGCGEIRTFVTIVLPLVKPVLVSLTLFTFITVWNDFLWPLVISNKQSMHTLTLAISTLKGNYSTNYGLVMAGATLAFLPPFILYALMQKQFVEGIALSGIKG